MKAWIMLTVVMSLAGSALALMNTACKSSHHAWCTPGSNIHHRAEVRHS
jgi:hypothetical protein